MAGVEILAMNEVITAYKFNWEIYIISIVVCTLVITIMSFLMLDHDIVSVIVGLMFGFILGAIIGILPAKFTEPEKYENQYKVIISDEVSMNDFLERYEIISQEGKIYTVRERD